MQTDKPDSNILLSTFLHDFETTIFSFTSAASLRGLLNLSVLFHDRVYIHDTALVDNRHVLESYYKEPDTGLVNCLRRYIGAGVVLPVVRPSRMKINPSSDIRCLSA